MLTCNSDKPLSHSPFASFAINLLGLLCLFPLSFLTYKFLLKNKKTKYELKLLTVLYLALVSFHLSIQTIANGPEIYLNWSKNKTYCKWNVFSSFIMVTTYYHIFMIILFYKLKLRCVVYHIITRLSP